MASAKDVYSLGDLRNWNVAGRSAWLAVIGDPVAHSRSPQMHNPALRETGIDAEYVRVHLHPDELSEGIARMKDVGFAGFNVTIPHKSAVFDAVDEMTETARRIGAINTVKIEDGRLLGHNTDAPGLRQAVEEAFGASFGELRVMLVGAGGGAGRAAAVQCILDRCPRLVLVNRTVEKAQALADEFGEIASGELLAIPWEADAMEAELGRIDLIVNATSVGMKPGDPEVVPARLLGPDHLVYDMVYAPARTCLMEDVEKAGGRAANGLGMLLWQGAIAFEYWFGRPAPVEAMRRGLKG